MELSHQFKGFNLHEELIYYNRPNRNILMPGSPLFLVFYLVFVFFHTEDSQGVGYFGREVFNMVF